MPRHKAACSTEAACRRHISAHEPVDAACGEAHLAYLAARRLGDHSPSSTATMGALGAAGADLDALAETRSNLELVKRASLAVLRADPSKLAPLSKRWSELGDELVPLQAPPLAAEIDPVDAMFGEGATVTSIDESSRDHTRQSVRLTPR